MRIVYLYLREPVKPSINIKELIFKTVKFYEVLS